MAGDWIKMRTDLYRDPKVCLMADILMDADSDVSRYVSQHCQRDMTVTRNVTRNAVVGALVAVWGVGRQRGSRVGLDMLVRGCTVSVIDDIADLPGFGDAMLTVGWAKETEEGVVFPKFFEEFNVEPAAEQKAKNAQRQQRLRDKRNAESNALRNVTVASQSHAREEKSREEKKKEENPPLTPPATGGEPTPEIPSTSIAVPDPEPTHESKPAREPKASAAEVPIPSRLDTPAFREVWSTWLADRAERKKPVTARAAREQLASLEPLGPTSAAECVRASIANQWQGIFPERFRGRGGGGGGGVRGRAQDEYAVGMLFNSVLEESNFEQGIL